MSPRLPNELIYSVLGFLVTSLYSHALAFRAGWTPFGFHNSIEQSDDGEQALVAAIQVCRVWRDIGTPFLYARPYLTSQRRLRLFSLILEQYPDLGRFVKEVAFMEQSGQPPLERETQAPFASNPNDLANIALTARASRTYLIRALRQCPNLRSLIITNEFENYTSVYPIDNFFLETSLAKNSLQSLVLYGSMFPRNPHFHPFLPASTILPNLRVLCLRSVYIPLDYTWPFLPHLHTLQLVENNVLEATTQFITLHGLPRGEITAACFPSLHTLETYHNLIDFRPDEPLLRQLEHYHSTHSPSAATIMKEVVSPHANTIRHLAMHIVARKDAVFSDWFLPEGLETVTVFMDTPVLMDLLFCLVRVVKKGKLPASLRLLRLVLFFPPGELIWMPTLVELRDLCAKKGVVCEFPIDDDMQMWITRRLTQDVAVI
ncbi:hypothetical protein EIP91_003119 [Steccherinum ochraceum]|uniref:Uncharacterized protein n=1 Tax=Steccherinum ochraceum TaxID=92696 RepID=A0A4R0RUN6_9APHY|nr:hypothetical protein EIP91_003119 [Steccherinum ochraceum]